MWQLCIHPIGSTVLQGGYFKNGRPYVYGHFAFVRIFSSSQIPLPKLSLFITTLVDII